MMKKHTLLLGLLLGMGLSAPAQTLVKDIVPGFGNSLPHDFTPITGGVLFLATDNANTDSFLWKTDGTTAGTTRVSNVSVTNSTSQGKLVKMGAYVYFTASTAANGDELWRTDGTTAGTALVKDIWPGTRGSSPGGLTVMNNRLYFSADDNVTGNELWVSDGTAAGTRLVKDIRTGPNPALGSGGLYDEMAVVNGALYFRAWDGLTGEELWKSNGTAAGTVQVKDLVPGITGCYPNKIMAFNGKVYFTADDRVLGEELYVSDGTAAGTRMLRDINPGAFNSYPADMTGMGTSVYFKASSAANGRELWKTDGTTAGTVMVKDIRPGTADGVPSWINSLQHLTPFNGYLYFAADDGTGGGFAKLYRTNGTAAGTTVFEPAATPLVTPSALKVTNSTLYFCAYERARNPSVGSELWKSNGTAAGTTFVGDIFPGGNSSEAFGFTYYNGAVLFSAMNYNNGRELWRYNAAPLATRPASPAAAAVWPNPVSSQLQVTLAKPGSPVRYSVLNALGQAVLQGATTGTVAVEQLPPGLYSLRLQPETDEVLTTKFIKE